MGRERTRSTCCTSQTVGATATTPFVCLTRRLYAHAHTFTHWHWHPALSLALTKEQIPGVALRRLRLSCKARRLGVSRTPLNTFSLKLIACSPRYYYGKLRQEYLLDGLKNLISTVHTHGFNPISIEPHVKDGGVFVHFEYTSSQSEDVLSTIQSDLRNYIHSKGGVPSSAGIRRGDIWVVRGQPWREVLRILLSHHTLFASHAVQDMNRFASPLLRVIFDGPDPHEESLYHTFRV